MKFLQQKSNRGIKSLLRQQAGFYGRVPEIGDAGENPLQGLEYRPRQLVAT